MMKIQLLSLIILLQVQFSMADDVVFIGLGGSGNWNEATNWSTGKVPGPEDNVTIPDGKCCALPWIGPWPKINNLVINGDIIGISNTSISLNGDLENNGTIDISGPFRISTPQGTVLNNGTIQASYMNIMANEIGNSKDAVIVGTGYDVPGTNFGVLIYAENEVANEGEISCLSREYIRGLNIYIRGKNINNWGSIKAGDSNQGDGGDVEIEADNKINNFGTLTAGNSPTGKRGSLMLTSRKSVKTGEVVAGARDPIKKINSNAIYDADIFVCSDTVYIDTRINSSGIIQFVSNNIICSIEKWLGIYGKGGVYFYTPAGGSADFSQTHIDAAIGGASAQYMRIYSDNIIEPTEGLEYIFHHGPEIRSSSDTTLLCGNTQMIPLYRSAGKTGTFQANFVNLSTAAGRLNYQISSEKGWVTPLTDSTVHLMPFGNDSTAVNYLIPADALSNDVDTVIAILTIIGSDFADTSYTTIFCANNTTVNVSIEAEDSEKPSEFTLAVYPNPFNASCRITAPYGSVIQIFDIRGRLVDELNDSDFKARIGFLWNPGEYLNSGIYVAKAISEYGKVMTTPLVYMK